MRFSALRFIAILLASAHIVAVAQTYAATKGTLIIGVLTVESSYAQNSERPSRGVPDTVQFWIDPGGAWRIRTYAIDHDIHPHSPRWPLQIPPPVAGQIPPGKTVEL